MEILEQQPAVVLPGKSKLRYPLRSASKSISKEDNDKPQLPSASSKRDRAPSTLSKSVGVLQLSGEDKSARPPRRRLSVPAKSVAATALKPPPGNITPISETRVKRSATKNDTPLSNASMASTRKKFNAIALASYWLSQIKISESVAKHSISLAFFKLALEAGCEPVQIQRLRNELKSYVGRHELSDFGESVKELFESYNISDHQEQVQVSETCSHVLPDDATRSSDDEVHSSLSITGGTRKLRPRSLNADAPQVSTVTQSANKETSQRKNTTATNTRGGSLNKNTENSRTVSDTGSRRVQKKPQKSSKEETTKRKIKKQEKKSAAEEGGGPSSPTAAAITPEENKENMDAPPQEEISLMT
ncbi:PREDICTED: uncharacterized protein LOC105141595 [Populus euphratica]|uniref:Uncharacterized protein LOC105141595 n=1 Tax=Populus euphratica TaxID=75702 RepID=A0AAJ6VFB4_POPEU|nr:PREDICTED: uncharacterized protein LOC105141595 [Populus euphratica]